MTTNSMSGDVAQFHEKFGLDNTMFGPAKDIAGHGVGPRPTLPRDLIDFRIKFLKEELGEFIEGIEENDISKIFDSLIDLCYVAVGTAHLFGFPFNEGWDVVHEANMQKVRAKRDGSDSARGSSWDIVKPKGWKPPAIDELLIRRGWTLEEDAVEARKPSE